MTADSELIYGSDAREFSRELIFPDIIYSHISSTEMVYFFPAFEEGLLSIAVFLIIYLFFDCIDVVISLFYLLLL
jgi:hypothetical protein